MQAQRLEELLQTLSICMWGGERQVSGNNYESTVSTLLRL